MEVIVRIKEVSDFIENCEVEGFFKVQMVCVLCKQYEILS